MEWKQIEGHQRYWINANGDVKSVYANGKEKILKTKIHRANNTKFVVLSENNKPKTTSIHTEVAKAFIPNPDNRKIVFHIDKNRHNNNVNNLRWITNSQHRTNDKLRITNNSGYTGVFQKPSGQGKWRAHISINGRERFIGTYKTKEEAIKKRKEAEGKYFKFD